MCSECDWAENKEMSHQIRKLCDCGNAKWQKTHLEVWDDETSKHPLNILYRCTKCDALSAAIHIFP